MDPYDAEQPQDKLNPEEFPKPKQRQNAGVAGVILFIVGVPVGMGVGMGGFIMAVGLLADNFVGDQGFPILLTISGVIFAGTLIGSIYSFNRNRLLSMFLIGGLTGFGVAGLLIGMCFSMFSGAH